MAAAVNKNISDEELRRRLLALRQTVGPITSTTRPVYLRKLLEAEAAVRSPGRRSTGGGGGGGGGGEHRFSSDESDDDGRRPSPRPSAPSTIAALRRSRDQPPRTHDDGTVPGRTSTAFNARGISRQFAEEEEEGESNGGTGSTSSSLCRPSINGVGQYKYTSPQRYSTNSFGLVRRDEGVEYSRPRNSYQNDFKDLSGEQRPRFRDLHRSDFSPSSPTAHVGRKFNSTLFSDTRDQQPSTASAFERAFVSSENKARDSHTSGKWQFVSMLLVALVVVFFLLLGYVYWYMTLSQSDPRNNYLLCANSEDSLYENCVPQESLLSILELTKHSVNFISSRAGDFDCGYVDSRNITLQEFNFLMERHGGAYLSSKSKVKNLILKLFVVNPHWTIQLYDRENRVTSDISVVKYLSSDKSQMSMWCRFKLSAVKVFSVLLTILLAAVILFLLFVGFKMWKKWKEEETKEVLKLVENIIDKVKQQADSSHLHPEVLPYLAIAHVRDSLIPLMERQKKQRIWDKAVEFISIHESRIRTEEQKIESEDFLVWHWVSPPTDLTKVWQGRAFGEHGNKVLNYPPTLTTCLKIRNMFDVDVEYGEDWHLSVEDAVIEKCGPDHGILHVAADRASKDGCVYVRCRDLDSAGRAFKALHGWWFDSKLVTVKYLREQRYYERFPQAAYASEPVKPSNTSQSSLSQPFHSSIIETS